jgi:hypothetical protein
LAGRIELLVPRKDPESIITASLATGVYLAHRTVDVFGASLADSQAWSNRLMSYASLGQLAADVTSPGNDIFQSRNVRPETRKFYTSRAVLRHALTTARRETIRTLRVYRAKVLGGLLLHTNWTLGDAG